MAPFLASNHGRWFAIGMAWLLLLTVLGVIAATRVTVEELPLQVHASAELDAPTPVLSRDGEGLLLAGNGADAAVAELRFRLPPPDPAQSRWVIWLGRDPVQALWLQRAGWSSVRRDFFRPGADEGMVPGGFVLPLPADWQGDISLSLHVLGDVRSALRPQLLRESSALRRAQRAIVFDGAAYAGLFVLALLALALYAAARERSFLALFGCASAALLMLLAQNGHLYLLPGSGLIAAWQSAGLWTLELVFCAMALQMLLRYADLRDGGTSAARLVNRYCIALVGLAALCLLDLSLLHAWLQPLVALAWVGTGCAGLVILGDAVKRRVPMACSVLLLTGLTIAVMLLRHGATRGYFPDGLWIRRGHELAFVATAMIVMIGLISRIGEYRDQGDRDRLARADSERRMGREAARTELNLALQTRLRTLEPADIEWTAFHLLLEHLLPQIPVETAAVVAGAYHGRDLLVVEPADRKQAMHDDIVARTLLLKRQAANALPLQQAVAGSSRPTIEALLPLPIRAPGWGMLLLQRAGSEGFTTEELALAGEFVRQATLHADEMVAAAQLRRSAEVDALTGSFNRRSMDQWLARAFSDAHRRQRSLSLLFIDIDHFKMVNDRLGHAAGDHCLRQVAMALHQALDPNDTLGRYGGEEFVALLPERGGADAREMGERLRAAVERCEIQWEGAPVRLTVSVGVATRLERESTPAAAVERADKALYAAKRGGRNCVHVAPAVFS